MDSFFGIGFPELVMILILAGMVMGPQRIRDVARTLGRWVAQMQAISRQFTRQLNAELDALDAAEVKGAVEDVKELRRELNTLRRQVTGLADDANREGRRAVEEGRQAFNAPVIRPPELPAGREGERTTSFTPPAIPSPEELPTPIQVPDDPE